ncbi:uncharacterized protein LOC135200796 isoform X2 [Macrobrachium nipponense]|uniref:uncharacterized protein LOC135200796 isoform X2 n=1 Tax=Macrobrachium nipponense TaxID=159736 RepID=UPI0030C7FAC6
MVILTRTMWKPPFPLASKDQMLLLLAVIVSFQGLLYFSRIPTGLRYFHSDTTASQLPLLFEINCSELMSRKPANSAYEKFCIFNDTSNGTWTIPITHFRAKLNASEMSHASTLSKTTWQKVLSDRPFKDRFKFIYKNRELELDGPVVNPVPSSITWQEDLQHVDICNSTSPLMLAVVPSAVPNRDRRDDIRRTWASPSLYSRVSLRTVFVVGATLDKKLQEDVEAEVKLHNDIIQYNFIDSYKNLTYKTMAWLTWVNKSCPEVSFVVKIDDDVIFNPFHLQEYLVGQLRRPKFSRSTQNLAGSLPRSHQEMILDSANRSVKSQKNHAATKWIYGCLETMPSPHRKHKWAVSMVGYWTNTLNLSSRHLSWVPPTWWAAAQWGVF